MENIYYYYITPNGEELNFKYVNAWMSVSQYAKGDNLPYYNGLKWIYEEKETRIELNEDVYCIYIHMYRHRIFMLFNGDSQHHPAPNNLVVYTPTGEIERILTTPILPNGRKGAGFMELGSSRHYLEKDMMNDKYLNVIVWEHEHSQWVDYYHLNTETLEFTFRHIGRY